MRVFVAPCHRKAAREHLWAALDLLHGPGRMIEKVLVFDTKLALSAVEDWCSRFAQIERLPLNHLAHGKDAVLVGVEAVLLQQPDLVLAISPGAEGSRAVDLMVKAGVPALVGEMRKCAVDWRHVRTARSA